MLTVVLGCLVTKLAANRICLPPHAKITPEIDAQEMGTLSYSTPILITPPTHGKLHGHLRVYVRPEGEVLRHAHREVLA